MRRVPILAITLAAGLAMAGTASADVTDAVATTSVAGFVTITGAAAGLVTAPTGTATNTTIGDSSAAIAGAVLTVQDATGTTKGWDVTATYAPLSTTELSALDTLLGDTVAVADLGAANVSVSANTTGLSAANALLGVADGGWTASAGSLTSPRTLLTVDGDGRGVTEFNTSYNLTIPAKGAAVATAYTGTIVYTVAPQAS